MLVLKKEMDFNEFEDEFSFELRGVSSEAAEIIFDSLCELNYNGDSTVDDVSDYIRFNLQVLSLEDVINDYGYFMDLEGLEDDDLIDAVKKHLDDKTYLMGSYEEDDTTYFIFDEF